MELPRGAARGSRHVCNTVWLRENSPRDKVTQLIRALHALVFQSLGCRLRLQPAIVCRWLKAEAKVILQTAQTKTDIGQELLHFVHKKGDHLIARFSISNSISPSVTQQDINRKTAVTLMAAIGSQLQACDRTEVRPTFSLYQHQNAPWQVERSPRDHWVRANHPKPLRGLRNGRQLHAISRN